MYIVDTEKLLIVQEFFWSFGNGTARNVITFGVDNSSSSHSGNCKNNVLILNKCSTFEINGSFGDQKKRLVLILVKQTQSFVCVYIITVIIIICLLMEKKSLNLKLTITKLNFQLSFV